MESHKIVLAVKTIFKLVQLLKCTSRHVIYLIASPNCDLLQKNPLFSLDLAACSLRIQLYAHVMQATETSKSCV